ncbi:glucosamine-6-phosphate deaminase [Aureococcus anophagefferens]|uniref:glucosamine-6-phosphate deaminase n=1 Tax=Aureococcus anophagefferens TaxID=44056 RepID=A0ABR1G188_AURAN
MRLLTFENKDKVGMHVAEHVVRRINEFQPTKERPFVIGLPTGSSPIPTYKHLIAMYQSGHVSFKHVVSFNMDEYAGLPRSHPESYHSFMWTTASRGRDGFRETLAGRTIVTDAPGRWTNFLGHVDIDPANVHILDGNAPDLEAECAAYEASIEKFGGIELFLAGIGPDGHIALSGAYDTIVANSRFFDNDLSKVPTKALTVGVATVMDAKEVLIIITGISKSLALRNCIEEPLSHMWTASAIQLHDKGVIVCDEDATMELRVKTVRYFDKLQKSPQGLYGDLGVGVVP